MDEPAQPFSMFTKFAEFPPEIRINIWAHACNKPRNVDLWSNFRRCEVEKTIFYTQLYESKLTQIPPPPILDASREARIEGLKHFEMEFRTNQHPGFYVNFDYETFVPRGNWNIISMDDFIVKRAQEQIRSIAIDITTEFYKDLYKEYILKKGWPFDVMEEVIFYDATGMSVFKKGYNGGKVELDFVDVKEPSSILQSAKERLCGIFVEMEQKERIKREKEELKCAARDAALGKQTAPSFKKPCVSIRELVVRPVTTTR
jgi:hypothetical protein